MFRARGIRRFTAVAVVCLSMAGTARAAEWDTAVADLGRALPAATASALAREARDHGVDAAELKRWAAQFAAARDQGLPAELLVERARQGLLKGVPVTRITTALESLRDNLTWAKGLVESHVPKAQWRAQPALAVQALRELDAAVRAGVSRPQFDAVLGRSQLTMAQMASLARVAGDLRGWGVPAERVVSIVRPVAAGGVTAQELDAMEKRFALGVTRGDAQEKLLAEFAQNVREAARRPVFDRDEIRNEMPGGTGAPDMRGPAGGGQTFGPGGGTGGYPGSPY